MSDVWESGRRGLGARERTNLYIRKSVIRYLKWRLGSVLTLKAANSY